MGMQSMLKPFPFPALLPALLDVHEKDVWFKYAWVVNVFDVSCSFHYAVLFWANANKQRLRLGIWSIKLYI